MANSEFTVVVNLLRKCNIVPHNHCLHDEDITQHKFLMLLRDGVVLCKLLHCLEPTSIDVDNEVKKSQTNSKVLCLQNLRLFLERCHSKFGLDPSKQFEADDLYNLKNVEGVLHTLKLLLSSRNISTDTSHYDPADIETMSELSDVQYDSLNFSTSSLRIRSYVSFPDENHYFSPNEYVRINSGQIYADHVDQNQYVEIQPIEDQIRTERDNVIKEIIGFEAKFTALLSYIIDMFVDTFRPAPGKLPLLPPYDVHSIFMFVPDTIGAGKESLPRDQPLISIFEIFLRLHSVFCDDLREAALRTDGKSSAIGQCFETLQSWYPAYAAYFGRVDSAITKIVQIKATASSGPCANDFMLALEQCEQRYYDKTGSLLYIENILRIPLDHVTKYADLLKRLRKISGSIYGNEMTLDISQAADNVGDFLDFVNSYKHETEKMQKIGSLIRSISGLPIHLDLLNSGELLFETSLRLTNGEEVQALLFEPFLLICAKNPGGAITGLTFKILVKLRNCSTSEPSADQASSKPWNSAFRITDDCKQSLVLLARSGDDRKKCIAAIDKAKGLGNKAISLQFHQFVPVSYILLQQDLVSCAVCNRYIINRAYICRFCSFHMHFDCQNSISRNSCKLGCDISAGRPSPLYPQRFPWWGGVMTGSEASKLLQTREEGTFMIRYSQKDAAFRVSAIYGEVTSHLIIDSANNRFRFPKNAHELFFHEFVTLAEMADWFMENSLNARIPVNKLMSSEQSMTEEYSSYSHKILVRC